jgi:hypothetical protein
MKIIGIDAEIVPKNEQQVSIRYCYWIETVYGKSLSIRFINILIVIDYIPKEK